MKNGFYADGFVLLTNKDQSGATLSLPFVGFRGKFADIPIMEAPIYKLTADNKLPFYYEDQGKKKEYERLNNFTHLKTRLGDKEVILGYDEKRSSEDKPAFTPLAISPNGDGQADAFQFVGTFFRNYKNLKMNVYEKSDTSFSDPTAVFSSPEGYKNFYSGHPEYLKSTTSKTWAWNGAFKNRIKDGKYVVEISADSVVSGGTRQKTYMDVEVDTVKPQVKKAVYDKNSGSFKIDEFDESGSGVKETKVFNSEGNEITPETDGSFNIGKDADLNKFIVKVTDNAYNTSEDTVKNAVEDGDFAKLNLNFKTENNALLPKFKKVIRDSSGNEVRNLDKVKPGRYKMEISDLDPLYELVDSASLEIEVKDGDKTVDWNIVFRQLPSSTVYITVNDDDAGEDFEKHQKKVKLYLENLVKGKKYTSSSIIFRRQMIKVPYGDYKLSAEGVAEGFTCSIKQDDPIKCYSPWHSPNPEVKITKAFGKINASALFDDGSHHEIRYKARNTATGQEYHLPCGLDKGTYEVSPLGNHP